LPGDDDDLGGCDCGKGWKGLPEVPLNGEHWPVEFAADALGIAPKDLRDLIRIAGVQPSGTAKIASFSRSGRHPRAYPADVLIKLYEAIYNIRSELGIQDHE
jgi:hypothetical protein